MEVRIARLEKAGREGIAEWRSYRDQVPDGLAGFGEGLKALTHHATSLETLITPALDDVISLAADHTHPLRSALHAAAISIGFSADEAQWMFDEMKQIGFKPVALVCADGFPDFVALLDGISTGESGLLLAGFVRMTGDPDTDQRIEKLVLRLRAAGVTASVFLARIVVVTAHFAVSHHRR